MYENEANLEVVDFFFVIQVEFLSEQRYGIPDEQMCNMFC